MTTSTICIFLLLMPAGLTASNAPAPNAEQPNGNPYNFLLIAIDDMNGSVGCLVGKNSGCSRPISTAMRGVSRTVESTLMTLGADRRVLKSSGTDKNIPGGPPFSNLLPART
jgi:hypothetical protein